ITVHLLNSVVGLSQTWPNIWWWLRQKKSNDLDFISKLSKKRRESSADITVYRKAGNQDIKQT
ncbi:Hypothetical protein FKW44_024996, partial [Caligus rogercresseyi]